MEEDSQKLIQFIRGIYPMDMEDAKKIASLFSTKAYAKHDFLLKEGKVCSEYAFLDEGFVRAFTYDIDGNDITTAFYPANGIVCEIYSFFKRIPAGESLQALTPCIVHCIDYNSLQTVFHAMPQFREFGRSILVNAYASLKQRMLSMIQQSAEQRYTHLIETNPAIFQHAPLKNIASYLGITDTSLSRIRKEYAKANH